MLPDITHITLGVTAIGSDDTAKAHLLVTGICGCVGLGVVGGENQTTV